MKLTKKEISNLPRNFKTEPVISEEARVLREKGFEELSKQKMSEAWGRGINWREMRKIHGDNVPTLPICPYGCGRAGTLLEIVMGPDNRALGIFNDHPCYCIFVAEMQLGEPPAKKKLVIGADGEYHEVSA